MLSGFKEEYGFARIDIKIWFVSVGQTCKIQYLCQHWKWEMDSVFLDGTNIYFYTCLV